MAVSRLIAVFCITLINVPGICRLLNPQSTSAGPTSNTVSLTTNSSLRDEIASKAKSTFGDRPLHFEQSDGDSSAEQRFLARSGKVDLDIGATDAVFRLRGTASSSSHDTTELPQANPGTIAMKLVGSNDRAPILGESQLLSRTNYLLGNDRNRWRRNVAQFSRVRVQSVYAGIDLVYYGSDRDFEYDFKIAAGASHKPIRLEFSGVKRVHISRSGDLVLSTVIGTLRHHKPIAYQLDGGVRRAVDARYWVDRNGLIGFRLGKYDRHEDLIIDPVLSFSTYFGGHDEERVTALAVDRLGYIYITGTTYSADLPLRSAVQPVRVPPYGDAFIAKLNPSGSALIYSTYLGGRLPDDATGIAVDNFGNAFVTGSTSSVDFPVTAQALQKSRSGPFDAFVTGITADGSALIYSTYLGGSSDDSANGIAIDTAGNVIVVGLSASFDFPTTAGAVQRVLNTPRDAFVTKFSGASHALLFSTLLGGSGADEATALAVDTLGNIYLTGNTSSVDFPITAQALQSQLSRKPGDTLPFEDAFVSKLSADGAQLIYSTYLGGSLIDHANAIAIDSSRNAYVAGTSASFDFPTTGGVLQHDFGGGFFESGNSGRQWQSSNNGLATPTANALAVDPRIRGHLYLASGDGFYSSSDAGETWRKVSNTPLNQLAIDATNPSTLYGSNGVGVVKTTDGGVTWTPANNSLPVPFIVSQLLIDPVRPEILYVFGLGFFPNIQSDPAAPNDASTGPPPPTPHFFFKSISAGATWEEVHSLFIPPNSSGLVVMDPQEPFRLFVTTAGIVFRSQDRGGSWRLMNTATPFTPIVADPTVTRTIYGLAEGVGKSTDDGKSWTDISKGLPAHPGIKSLYAVPTTPTTLYASARDGIFKSADAGLNWQPIDPRGDIAFFGFEPSKLSAVYAGVNDPSNAFVTKVNPSGSSLVYSTFLGGQSADEAHSVSVDDSGNAYVAGMTMSSGFPTVNALLATKPASRIEFFPAPIVGFLAKLNSSGDNLLYSTYLGGDDYTVAQSVITNSFGELVVAGQTAATNFTVKDGLQSFVAGNLDAFVLKFEGPLIDGWSVSGNNLVVEGHGFDQGAIVLIDNKEQLTKVKDSRTLVAKKGAKQIPVGRLVQFQVRNSDGTLSNVVTTH